METTKRKVFSSKTILLILCGIALNLLFSRICNVLELPLYLDSIGTLICSVLGGILPGIVTGFFSNILGGIIDDISMYYGVVSILIATVTVLFAQRGYFSKLKNALVLVLPLSLVGGGIGSVITWMLYGFQYGSGDGGPFAILIHENTALSEFWSQFSADYILDIADKFLTVLIAFGILALVPSKVKAELPMGRQRRAAVGSDSSRRVKLPLKGQVAFLIILTAAIVGLISTCISFVIYSQTTEALYVNDAAEVTERVQQVIGDKDLYSITAGSEWTVKKIRLDTIKNNTLNISRLYIFYINDSGMNVLYDSNYKASNEYADAAHLYEPPDKIRRLYMQLFRGEQISHCTYRDSDGATRLAVFNSLANSGRIRPFYICAEADITQSIIGQYVYIIKMISLILGASIIIIAFAFWYAEKTMVNPIKSMTEVADDFAFRNRNSREESTHKMESLNIKTGNEIEYLYNAMNKTVADVAQYASIIEQMQNNIIVSFASMVESRDSNTGEHIKHTAAYVGIIANQMKRDGMYPETLTEDFIALSVRSAPLHDVGKIEVPDAILNKPGKLTAEEFEIMKTHTVAGKNFLKGVIAKSPDGSFLEEAVKMAAYHHERWDGTGYPERLTANEIPLSARIMAVADVFDALISKRSYKNAFDTEKAFDIIKSESGTHFDPDIVTAFCKAREEILAVRQG